MNRRDALAIVALVLLPLLWLWPCTFGDRYFVSYDVDQFPPVRTTATDAELATARDGANFDVTEVPVWFLPELEFARDELRAGRLPVWNPRARTGAPLHAHGLIGLCYPPNWIALFADQPAARLGVVAWINLMLGGLLAFGLLRQVGLGAPAAFVGAALFELSGPMAANSFFWMRLASYVWLPGVLWAMLRIAHAERVRPLQVAGLAVAFAMTWLGGFPPFAATATVFAGLWFVWLCGARFVAQDRRHALRLCGWLALGLGLGACWSLPQVLPSLLFFPDSARPPTPAWDDISGQAFEPYGLLTWLMPDAFGHPSRLDGVAYHSGPMQLLLNTRALDSGRAALPNYNYTEYSLTISSLGLLLAALGLLSARGRYVWFARAACGFALGLGLFLPVLQWLFHLPVVQNVWPMRWPAAGTLFVAWLAALGVDRLRTAKPRVPIAGGAVALLAALILWWSTGLPATFHRDDPDWAVEALMAHYDSERKGVVDYVQGDPPGRHDRFAQGFDSFARAGSRGALWLGGAGAVLLLFGLLRGRGREVALGVGVAAAIAQLALHGQRITHGTAAPGTRGSEVHTFLRERTAALAGQGGATIVRATAKPVAPWPGQFAIDGLRDLNYYSHADARTLQPLRRLLDQNWQRLQLDADVGTRVAGKGYLTTTLPAALLRHPWFDLVGLRFVLSNEAGLDRPPFRLGEVVGPQLRGRGEAFFVHERPRALPRAFVVPKLEVLADDEAVLAALTAPTLAPAAQAYVVLGDLAAAIDPDEIDAAPNGAPMRAVTFLQDHASHIELDVEAGAGRALVLADTFLPGWSASIDGEPATIVRCNHSQRLVALPDGACRVVLHYTAPGLTAGLSLAAFATLCAIATWWLVRARRRRELAPPAAQA
jgi:hypothetical protein